MINVSAKYKPFLLIAAQTATATVNGSAVQLTGDEQDGVAIVCLGAVMGGPSAQTCTVTISASATQNGTYTTIATFPTSTAGTAQVGTARVLVNQGLYSWVKATATIAFTGGTTPSFPLSVVLLQNQTIETDSNIASLS